MAVYFGKVCPWIRMIAIFASCFLVRNVDAFSLSMPVLYSGKEPGLTIVDVKSLNQTLFNQTYAVAFEFYNSWCGHCARFAPIWKQFAGDLRHWSSVVQVIALDCAVEENTSVCRQYEVEMYPSVRLFPPNVNGSQEHGHQLTELQPKAELLRNLTLRYLIDYQSKNLIKDWPVLQPIKSIDEWFTIKSFIKSRNASDIQVFLYVEPYDSLNGSQIILEMSNYKDKVLVYRIENNNTDLIAHLLPFAKPLPSSALIHVDNGSFSIEQIHIESNKFGADQVVNMINQNYLKNIMFKDEQELAVIESNSSPSLKSSPPNAALTKDELYINDLYGALQFTLFNQIPLKNTLNSTQLLTLQRFLRVIKAYFPFDQREPSEFVERLLNMTLEHSHSLDIEMYLTQLRSLNYDFSARFTDWKTCKGSTANYRGYPCSLWSLFHTLTVREYMHAEREQKWVNLHEVLFTMRDYIATFFSCSNCARHFVSMATNLEQQLQQPNSSVLWLWKAHNIVNRRLSKDLTEDPQHPKQQFPPISACPYCWNQKNVSSIHTSTNTSTIVNSNSTNIANPLLIFNFNETNVLAFLINRYEMNQPPYQPHASSPVAASSSPASSFAALQSDSAPGTVPRRMLFDYTDISICFTLYFFTTLLLFTIFFVLRMRNRRKHSKYSKKPLPFGDF